MPPSQDFLANHPFVYFLVQFLPIVFYLSVLWVFGRMGDNINKIRKMLEQELKKRPQP